MATRRPREDDWNCQECAAAGRPSLVYGDKTHCRICQAPRPQRAPGGGAGGGGDGFDRPRRPSPPRGGGGAPPTVQDALQEGDYKGYTGEVRSNDWDCPRCRYERGRPNLVFGRKDMCKMCGFVRGDPWPPTSGGGDGGGPGHVGGGAPPPMSHEDRFYEGAGGGGGAPRRDEADDYFGGGGGGGQYEQQQQQQRPVVVYDHRVAELPRFAAAPMSEQPGFEGPDRRYEPPRPPQDDYFYPPPPGPAVAPAAGADDRYAPPPPPPDSYQRPRYDDHYPPPPPHHQHQQHHHQYHEHHDRRGGGGGGGGGADPHARPPPLAPVVPANEEQKALQDLWWECYKCKSQGRHCMVAASKHKCRVCGSSKPAHLQEMDRMETLEEARKRVMARARSTDWFCEPCRALLFGAKTVCNRCGSKRPY